MEAQNYEQQVRLYLLDQIESEYNCFKNVITSGQKTWTFAYDTVIQKAKPATTHILRPSQVLIRQERASQNKSTCIRFFIVVV